MIISYIAKNENPDSLPVTDSWERNDRDCTANILKFDRMRIDYELFMWKQSA